MWPLRGWWTTDELSGWVQRCAEPAEERCLGGRFNDCGNAYQGDFCSSCAPDYYEDGGWCFKCDAATTKALGRVNSSFRVVANIIHFFFPFPLLMLFRAILGDTGKLLGVVGSLGKSPDGLEWLGKIWAALQILNLDVKFGQPGCGMLAMTALG